MNSILENVENTEKKVLCLDSYVLSCLRISETFTLPISAVDISDIFTCERMYEFRQRIFFQDSSLGRVFMKLTMQSEMYTFNFDKFFIVDMCYI